MRVFFRVCSRAADAGLTFLMAPRYRLRRALVATALTAVAVTLPFALPTDTMPASRLAVAIFALEMAVFGALLLGAALRAYARRHPFPRAERVTQRRYPRCDWCGQDVIEVVACTYGEARYILSGGALLPLAPCSRAICNDCAHPDPLGHVHPRTGLPTDYICPEHAWYAGDGGAPGLIFWPRAGDPAATRAVPVAALTR